ncbi:MAG: HD domain-containing protein [Ignisphaera sp.]
MSFIDPIHGRIGIPSWLNRILNHPLVRRTMFIRQLGLKAYIDFPGAIHTRFSHLIGTMHLAGKLCDILVNKLSEIAEGKEVRDIINQQKNNIMIAGFLHDIGHGPFSHAIDFALKRVSKYTHEEISSKLIEEFSEIEAHADLKKISQIVSGKFEYPFITKIINGPIDVDKLDYLIRDSYHVGLKYYFDVELFMYKYALIGLEQKENLKKITLGLEYQEDDKTAITTAEIFLTIWRGMYDLVYYKDKSRVAEKMLEYAVLHLADEKDEFKNKLLDLKELSNLDDDSLLRELEKGDAFCQDILQKIRQGNVYKILFKEDLGNFANIPKFWDDCKKDPDNVGYILTQKICEEKGLSELEPAIICDIVPSKVLKEKISLSKINEETGEPYDLTEVSDILSSFKPKFELRICIDQEKISSEDNEKMKEEVKNIIKGLIEEWK